MGNPENPEWDGKKKPVKVNQYQYQDLSNLNQPDATNRVNNVRIPDMKKIQEQKVVKNTTAPKIEDLKTLVSNDLAEKAKDPDIKNATEKILAGCLKWKTVNMLLDNRQDFFANKNISVYIGDLLKTNPELLSFIPKLWIDQFIDKKYEQLLPSQKLTLLALDDVLTGKASNLLNPSYKDANGKIDLAKFEKVYAEDLKKIVGQLQIDTQLTQLSNFWKINTTLKDDYKLTEAEANKYIAYLEAIKNQPKAYQEAGPMWLAIYGGLMLVLWFVLGLAFYKTFLTPSESKTTINGETNLWAPEYISKMLSMDIPFTQTGQIKREQYKINPDDGFLMQQAKKAANALQTREIMIQTTGKIAVEYDLKWMESWFDPKTNTLKLIIKKSPVTIIHESSSKIVGDNTQVLQTKDFENLPMLLEDSLKNVAKGKVSWDAALMMQAHWSLVRNLYDMYNIVCKNMWNRIDNISVIIFDEKWNSKTMTLDVEALKKKWTEIEGQLPQTLTP